MLHLAAFLFFSCLSAVFLHHLFPVWATAIPGNLEDTRLFLWNAWWFRYAIDTLHTSPYFTKMLFFPFGGSLISHDFPLWMNLGTYCAQAAGGGWIAASNVWFAVTWTLCGFCTYLLVWEVTGKRAPAVVAGIYVMTHSYTLARAMQNWGQFNLYGIALFLWTLVRARKRGRPLGFVFSGAALAWTAACHYYFLIYSATIWLVSFVIDFLPPIQITKRVRRQPFRKIFLGIAILAGCVAAWIVFLHPGQMVLGSAVISLGTPANALLVMWLALLLYWASGCQLTIHPRTGGLPADLNQRIFNEAILCVTAVIALSPLLWSAVQLAISGGYPRQGILWKTHLPGANLFALISPNPIHAIWGKFVSSWYESHGMNAQEQAAGIGLVCLAVLIGGWYRAPALHKNAALKSEYEVRSQRFFKWLALAAASTLLAMGTYLHILQYNLWLPLPFYAWRLLPVLGNVRVPERWMAVGAIAWAVVLALGLIALAARKGWPLRRLCVIVGALILFENWPGLPVGEPPANRPIFETLRQQPPGGVLVLPLYVGDSSIGAGHAPPGLIWDYLVHQIYHQKPVLGGYVGRVQRQLIKNYAVDNFFGRVIQLEENPSVIAIPLPQAEACSSAKNFQVSYVLMFRSALGAPVVNFVENSLPMQSISRDSDVQLYRLTCPN